MVRIRHLGFYFFLFLFLIFSHPIFALEQQGQLWLDASISDPFKNNKQIFYAIDARAHFVDQRDYHKFTWINAGLGYAYTPTLSFWSGYQWLSHDVTNDKPVENRIWEQMVWQIFQNDMLTIRTRTRFEQTSRMHEPGWNNRVREKVSFYFPAKLFNKYTPLIYDEMFINLNKPNWMSDADTIDQNQLFIGLDIPTSKTIFLEVGYIAQSLFNRQNTALNHVIYLGINFNPSGEAITQYIK